MTLKGFICTLLAAVTKASVYNAVKFSECNGKITIPSLYNQAVGLHGIDPTAIRAFERVDNNGAGVTIGSDFIVVFTPEVDMGTINLFAKDPLSKSNCVNYVFQNKALLTATDHVSLPCPSCGIRISDANFEAIEATFETVPWTQVDPRTRSLAQLYYVITIPEVGYFTCEAPTKNHQPSECWLTDVGFGNPEKQQITINPSCSSISFHAAPGNHAVTPGQNCKASSANSNKLGLAIGVGVGGVALCSLVALLASKQLQKSTQQERSNTGRIPGVVVINTVNHALL